MLTNEAGKNYRNGVCIVAVVVVVVMMVVVTVILTCGDAVVMMR